MIRPLLLCRITWTDAHPWIAFAGMAACLVIVSMMDAT
jgi:hypothetical protein